MIDYSSNWQTLYLRNRHLLVLTIVVSLAAGLFGIFSLNRFEDPRIINRYPLIITPFPGASAERVETLITEKLEDELAEVSEIKKMTSTSLSGVSIIVLELADSIDSFTFQEVVFAEIRDRIRIAARQFPNGAEESVFDDKRDPAGFSLIASLTWDHESEPMLGILNRLAEDLADRLRTVPGTELVRLYGAPDEELTVFVDHRELIALGLDVPSVARLIAAADSKRPAGVLRGSNSDVLIEVEGEIDSVKRVADIPLLQGEDQTVIRVGDVAEVKRGWRDPPIEIAIIDGKRAVLVAARMGMDRRIDLWTDEAIAVLDEFRTAVGDGIIVDTIFEQGRYTNDRFEQLSLNMLIGAGVVACVVFLMMGWQLGLIVGLALPLVVALTLFTFLFTGDALHQMSVYGIVIALGLLIDNAIVMVDEVTKRKAQGKPPARAVTEAINHLFLPLVASTLTTVLAFMPMILVPGGVGDFVGSIGRSVIIAVSWSFILAMTVTAALAGIFAKPSLAGVRRRWWRDGIGHRWLSTMYQRLLSTGVRLPLAGIAVALFLPLTGFVLFPSLGNSFMPPVDRDMFEIRVWMPNESSLENTRLETEAIEETIRSYPEVTRVYWLVGASFPRVFYNMPMDQDNSSHFAHAIVSTESDEATKRVINKLQVQLDERFPGAQILARQFRQGPPVVADIEYRIYGPQVDELQILGERMRRALQTDPEVLVTQATMTRGEPKLWLKADEDQARIAGLSLDQIAVQIQAGLEGQRGGTMIEDLEEIPVRVRYRDDRREDIGSIASTNLVAEGSDHWIPLTAIGELTLRPELSGTTRYNGVRCNIIKGYTTTEALPINVAQRVLGTLDAEGFELPPGYRIELGGTVEQEKEARGNLIKPLPILGVFIVAILILTFRSVFLAVVLGVVAIMSVGLAIFSTWLIDFPISFNTFIGTFGLIGVAFNDSIIVLAAIRANPRAAAGETEGLVEAVTDTTRHVLSTTLTTIGGFLPLILIVGGDFWPSMAIVLAGGITGASIMALLFIPAMYRLLRRWVAVRSVPDHVKTTLPVATSGVLA